MSGITIGIVASSRQWRTVLQAHMRDHVADVRVQILREPRMALELDLDVVVIDDVSSFLTRDKVSRLREKGTRVVGIYDPEGQEGLGEKFLENLGVDLSLPSTVSPEEMINAFSQLQSRERKAFEHAVPGTEYQDQNSNPSYLQNYAQSTFNPASSPTQNFSSMVSVSGPAGSGSTEIAVALANIVSTRNARTLLMDCDEVGPSVARRIGFHLHPNILSAIDAVSNMTHPLPDMVGRPSDRVANNINFEVMPGIANPEDWSQLRSGDLADVFVSARKTWRYIICNTGSFAEDLSGYGIERFGSTRATLEYADLIIGVMSPTPTGYMRFLDWMATLRTVSGDRQVFIVVNKAPKSSYIKGEIENQLAKDIDPRFMAGLFFVPYDEKVNKAEWEGQLLNKGPFFSAVNEIASYVLPANQAHMQAPISPPSHDISGTQAVYNQGSYVNAESQPRGYSWDDADVAAPNVEPNIDLASAEQLQPTVDELENSIAHTLDQHEVNPSPPMPAHPVVAPPVIPPEVIPHVLEPTQPSVVQEGYVPAFKRGENVAEDSHDQTFTTSDSYQQHDTSRYTTPGAQAQQPDQSQQSEPHKSGYVPHFIDDKKKDKQNSQKEDTADTDDNPFWGP